ncbi:MAG: hypothetical protein JWO05_2389 [Gemmatimonadetes bacterium]|nr:hypothetical protein [Gemmatimonadota bacterium]
MKSIVGWRSLSGLASAAGLLSCTHIPTTVVDVPAEAGRRIGTYALVSLAGVPLPATAGAGTTVISSQLVVAKDGNWTEVEVNESTANGQVTRATRTDAGKWAVQYPSFVLFAGATPLRSGPYGPDSLALTNEKGLKYIYKR